MERAKEILAKIEEMFKFIIDELKKIFESLQAEDAE